MKFKNYLSSENLQSACFASTRIYVTLAALLVGSTLMAQETPELVDSSPLNPKDLTELGNRIYFNGESSDGEKWLYSTTGEEAVRHSGIVQPGQIGDDPSEMIAYNGQLILNGQKKFSGSPFGYFAYELLSFDHSETYQVLDSPGLIKQIGQVEGSDPRGFTELNGDLYFSADDGINGEELWVTDGTENGTQLLKDINTGSDDSDLFEFYEYNGNLIFNAVDGNNGIELWITDGTSNNTEMVKNISPGSVSSVPVGFTEFDGKVYFTASSDEGREPWVTDGTEGGTHILKDIYPGGGGTPNNSFAEDFTVYDGNLYFRADGGTNGKELWVSDGTENGTELFKDINPGSSNSLPSNFKEYNGKLYFSAKNGSGHGLWVTDGTDAGTVMIQSTSSIPRNLFTYDDRLYFVADDGSNGRQLWVSDGTVSGTEIVSPDVAPNVDPLPEFYEFEQGIVDGTLYYTADYDGNGLRLYKLTTDHLSVEELTKDELTVYPNPVEDILHLESNAYQISEVVLFSTTGQRLKSWEGQSEIDLSQFSQGSYFVKISTADDQTVTKQIIKK